MELGLGGLILLMSERAAFVRPAAQHSPPR